jgi:glucose-6-phosphate 1-dehydrogenase
MIRTLLLLGATGDLSRRFLFPALGALEQAGHLPREFRVIGAARQVLDDDGLGRLANGVLPADRLTYRTVDLADRSSLAATLAGAQDPVAVYLALPPAVFATTIESLARLRLAPRSRIVIEKPFGEDLDSAHALNALLAKTGVDAYRVDHVLGMDTTQNLVALRRGNRFIDRIWNSESVERVDILWEETLALEGRAGFYDRAGALKDVLENHLAQLLTLVAMDAPTDDGHLHRMKLDALASVHVRTGGRRARYTAGTLADGRKVGAYADERGVDPARGTETFAEVVLEIETPRWIGTPFVLRAGKALACRRKLVRLHFRGGGELQVGIDGPTDIILRLHGAANDQLQLRAAAPGNGLPPYANVLLDVLRGTSELAVSAEEAEQAWRLVAPVVAAWGAGDVPLQEYPAGSAGPISTLTSDAMSEGSPTKGRTTGDG